jgi:hypothetical protein
MLHDHVLRGTVKFEQDLPAAGGTVMHVLVEAVPHADAAATIVARLDLPLGNAVPMGAVLPFSLPVRRVDTAGRYEVRVHVDRSGTGRVARGDHLSTRSCPVLTQGWPDVAELAVVPV